VLVGRTGFVPGHCRFQVTVDYVARCVTLTGCALDAVACERDG
jgi:hypothetical protein